ncbi:trypsin-like peptidase domain-containing protein [Singulisphaera acidiphila]|uniref:Trypsin-like serine protease with C-terminal PDZ domain n=1 Tax=Singulisphaera acidiphila (strain ATCC BAA-1392 / DSM 18658 / VKM B-2454 / MOB10) TaxID=886293 RepID=L0DNW6_SINAD|nr:trypsin-like peptidase domain-containing protein [Singulisphaera acidiphila]AGA30548.1 trypsin-like serine protease with C-terminal PDZ domain [Singulisphaera acidiphila DSM 18658]
MKRNVIAWAALAVSTAALVSSQNLTRQVPAAPKMPAESQKTARALSDAFASVAEYTKPSVVQISVQRKVANSPRAFGNGRALPPGSTPKDLEDFLKEMRKRFNPEGGLEPQQFGGIAQGTGSGFVYDDQGHILTNNHVVADAGKIVVKFHDGVEAPAHVVGTDPKSDVAVIKVENTSYPALAKGDSSKVRVGEIVMAVGSPFGLSQTVTTGIVSATERNDLGINDANDAYESFLQTDASINPGNSGGPLVDMDGRVIGINSAIMSGGRGGFGGGGGGNDGVGFAIPIDLASNVADKLIKDGKVSRARIGVAIGNLSPAEAKILGIDSKTKGALVQQVVPGSPAEKAGLKQGDVIVDFDDKPVLSVPSFRLNVAASEIGKPYNLKYFRDGKEHLAKVTLGSADVVLFDVEKESAAPEKPAAEEAPKTAIKDFGLEVQPLTEELAKGLGLKEAVGLLITSVKEDSPASAKGLEPGMVITQVIRDKKIQPVKSVKDFQELSEQSDDLMVYIKSSKIPGAFVTLSKLKKD